MHKLVLAFHHLVFVSLDHCFFEFGFGIGLVWLGFFGFVVFLSDTGLTNGALTGLELTM